MINWLARSVGDGQMTKPSPSIINTNDHLPKNYFFPTGIKYYMIGIEVQLSNQNIPKKAKNTSFS